MPRPVVLLGMLLAPLTSCASVWSYTGDLHNDPQRSLFTRAPAALFGGTGFALGIPVVIVVAPVSWIMYRSVPEATRDPLTVFLFPSVVLWKAGALLATPFDLVEWVSWRAWQEPVPLTPEQREEIERRWDALEYPEYPVRAIHPAGRRDAD